MRKVRKRNLFQWTLRGKFYLMLAVPGMILLILAWSIAL